MKHETTSVLLSVSGDLTAIRAKLDAYMYHSAKPLPAEDKALCRAIYDSVCKIQDML